jgi:hypothetical protein
VWFGTGSTWAQRTGVTGSIVCSVATFGDPAPGIAKACRDLVTGTSAPNTPPTVSMTAPSNNAAVTQGVAVTLGANASDANGSVARVEFFVGPTLVATATSAPYSASWTPAAAGTYTLTARATDNAGAATTSAAVTLTVTAAVAPPPPPPPPPPAVTWVRCATLNGVCRVPGTTTVRYIDPVRNQRAERTVTGITFCMSQMFGFPFVFSGAGYCEYRQP